MTDDPMFVLPQSLMLLVIMQFATAFLGWWLKRPLLPIVSTGLLTGTVFGWVFYQFIPTPGGKLVAGVIALVIAACYCAVMVKGLARAMRSTTH